MNSANLISVAVIGLVMATLSALPVYADSTEPSATLIASQVCKRPSQWTREQENPRESVERSIDGARRNTSTGDS